MSEEEKAVRSVKKQNKVSGEKRGEPEKQKPL